MRDPFSWSIPIGRIFGITVRVHILMIVLVLGLYLRVVFAKEGFPPGSGFAILSILALLFLAVLLHELGHCYGAYLAEGEANDVLLWPLGGLAFVDVPHTARANFIATVWGPLVNVILCLGCGLVLAASSIVPPFNPAWNPLFDPLYSWAEEGYLYTHFWHGMPQLKWWQLMVARFFYLNWFLFLINVLIVAYPMDGGRLLQCALWPRMGYHRSTKAAVFVGFVFMFILAIFSIAANEVLVLALALFILYSCRQTWLQLQQQAEESLFGYDFSQGYTSLEKDDPEPKRKKPGFIKRWLQKRAAKRLQRERELQEAEEKRMDALLEKIQQQGADSLTDEERRFLKRMAEKKAKNRQ